MAPKGIVSQISTEQIPGKDYRKPRSLGLFAPILRTERLILRFWDRTADDDAEWILWTFTIPEVAAMTGKREWGTKRPTWDAMEEKWHLYPSINAGQVTIPLYLVDSIETGERIGYVGMRQVFKIPDLGYTVLPQHWGKGYATEMALELLRHAVEDVGIKSIMGFTVKSNEKSQRVLKKIGLHYKGDAWKDGATPKEGEDNVDGVPGTSIFALPELEAKIWLENRGDDSSVNGENSEADEKKLWNQRILSEVR